MMNPTANIESATATNAGFKQTEVGVIPEDWSTDKIQNLCRITTGDKNTQDRINGGSYPFFVRSQTIERINSYSYDGEAVLTAGDGVGTGKIFHYIKGRFDFHQRVYKMSDFAAELDGYYFYQYFSNNFYNRIIQMTAKSSVDSVRRDMIANMVIPIPPKSEQNAIATALSDMDALIQAQEELLAKKRALKQGAMQELLTGKRRLVETASNTFKQTEVGRIPVDWEVVLLSECAVLGSGTTPSRELQDRYYKNGSIPWVKTLDLNNASIHEVSEKVTDDALKEVSSLKTYPVDSVLIAMYGGFNQIGRTGILAVKACVNQAITVIQSDRNKLNPKYLIHYLNHSGDYWKSVASSSRKDPNITSKDVKEFPIRLPALAEQTAIATALSDMDTEIEQLEAQLTKYRQVKVGMMQELLTGQKRLV